MKTITQKHLGLTTTTLLLIACMSLGCTQVNHKKASREGESIERESIERESIEPADCAVPSTFTPMGTMGVPQVESSNGSVETVESLVELHLKEEGEISASVQTKLFNKGKERSVVLVGYLERIPAGVRPHIMDLQLVDSGDVELMVHSKDSPRNLQRPYTDTTSYVCVTIDAEATREVTFTFTGTTKKASKPTTLLGYPDMFARNWKNWSWPYTKSPIFEEIAQELEFQAGTFSLGDAAKTNVVVKTVPSNGELRGLSAQQNLDKVKDKKTASWLFTADNTPPRLNFEYVCNADFDKEIAVFSKLVEERSGDLRAHVHLADLYLVNGDHLARAPVLKKILEAYGDNADEQMLTKRNDIRPAIYAGLVESLLATGQNEEAKNVAMQGTMFIEKLIQDNKSQTPQNSKYILSWLKTQ